MAQGFVLLILYTLPSRAGICTDALLAKGSRTCAHAGTLLHGIIGVHHDEVTVLQSGSDVYLGAEVFPYVDRPQLDDIVLHDRHKLTRAPK